MLNNNIFYHSITRKIIVAFGSLFSNIRISRKKDDQTMQTLNIPITYAPKEKWLVRIEQDPTLEHQAYGSFPRMSFEMTGITYDSSRKMNRMSTITCGDGTDSMKRVYSPVPYNIDISLYIISKTQEDVFQIVEQILPYFTPEYTLSIRSIPESNIVMDIPIIINGVSMQDEYDGDFETRRFVTYTLTFTLKAHMFGPVTNGGIITRTLVDVTNINTVPIFEYDAIGNPSTGVIIETINEN